MTDQFTYLDGSPVRNGDFVRIEHGSIAARVDEIVDTPQLCASHGLQSCGVIVDAPPRGFVFLSASCLSEDELQFVRRGPGEKSHLYSAVTLGVAAIMILPALYSLLNAIFSAFSTGQVLVISLGRTATYRTNVPWYEGWARFVAPVLLMGSLCLYDESRGLTTKWWLAAGGSAIALTLLGFSSWFTSVNGAFAFLGLVSFVALAILIDRRIGSWAALVFVAIGVSTMILKATSTI